MPKKLGKVARVALAVAVVVASVVVAARCLVVQAGSMSVRAQMEGAQGAGLGDTVQYDGHTYERNTNIVSVVVMGYDESEVYEEGQAHGQADVVMVLALDTESGEATCIGVPRDSMVDVDEYVGDAYIGQERMQLCLAFSFGNGTEQGAELTARAVSRIMLGMPMSYYFALNMNGVAPINDAVGGVEVQALQTIPDTNIREGETYVLHGDDALAYIRWRDESQLHSSLDRQARQVQYVKSFARKVLSMQGGIWPLLNLYGTLADYSATNLGLSDFSYLASIAVGTEAESFDVVTLQGDQHTGTRWVELDLDEESVRQTVLDVYYDQVD